MLRLLLLLVLLTTQAGVTAQGIEFFSGSWEEALVRAEAEDKLIFVDAYTTWCGPCKRMTAQVFPLPEVGEVFNADFINVKLDMEATESESFRRVHRVSAYPTMLFINAKNEAVHRIVGAKRGAQLIAAAKEATAKLDDLEVLAAAHAADPRDATTTFRYVRALVRHGEPHLKIANDYLRENAAELTGPENLRIIFVAATEADSRIFDLVVRHEAEIVALEGRDNYDRQWRAAIDNTFAKGLEFRNRDLLEAATAKLGASDAAAGKRLALRGQFELALRGHDTKELIKATKDYLKKGADGDVAALRRAFVALAGSSFIRDERVIDLTAEAGEAAAEGSADAWRDYYNLARFLRKQDRAEEALGAARKSLDRLGPDGNDNFRRAIQDLVDQLEDATKK